MEIYVKIPLISIF